MVILFTNKLKAYYEYVIVTGQQFTNVVLVTKCIEQGIWSGRIFVSTEKKCFRRRRKDVDNIVESSNSKNKKGNK